MAKATSQSGTKLPKNLERVADGIKKVSATFGVTLYTNVLFSTVPDAILESFNKYLSLCPKEELRHYATENMTMHKPVTPRALGMLATWLKPGAPEREYIMQEIKNGEDYRSAPTFKFLVAGGEKDSVDYFSKHANLLSMAFPAEWGFQRTDEMLQLVVDLCNIFPVRSGHAGLSLECCKYDEMESQQHAWQVSMRFRGLDIALADLDSEAAGHDGLRGVNWLTILGDALLKKVGGTKKLRKNLSDAIELIDIPGGVIIKAGPAPAVGDTNRGDFVPLYQEVYRAVEKLVEKAISRYGILSLITEDDDDDTKAWLRRLAGGP